MLLMSSSTVIPSSLPPIAWLCGGLHPGADGVGDYVRRTARELALRRGVPSVLVALRDPHVTRIEENGPELRLPAGTPEREAMARVADFLERARVAALAWNLVPQAIAPRGCIPESLAGAHARLGLGRHVVVYLHELWCGTGYADPLRDRWSGWRQRPGIVHWLRVVRPARTLTSNSGYAAVLAAAGVAAQVLPLAGNISREASTDRERWPVALRRLGFDVRTRTSSILAGVFGAIHPGWEPSAALDALAAFARKTGRRIDVVWFGRGSRTSERRWLKLAATLAGPDVRWSRAGPLPPAEISEIVESCDLGLPTIHYNLLGKSGTAATFREHGVPLLAIADGWWPRNLTFAQPAPPEGVCLWPAARTFDWSSFLASRPVPPDLIGAATDQWAAALAIAPRVAGWTPAQRPVPIAVP